jgi:hypothetical protein
VREITFIGPSGHSEGFLLVDPGLHLALEVFPEVFTMVELHAVILFVPQFLGLVGVGKVDQWDILY